MAEQNPWKKQMMNKANPNPSNNNTNNPSEQTTTETNPWKQQIKKQVPAWMKKNENQSESSQPSWMKKKDDSKEKQVPAWQKKTQQPGSSQPSWMKKTQQSGSNQPAWLKKNDQVKEQPAWMKKKDDEPKIETNPWKAKTTTKFQTPQEKRAREEKEQKQERERLQEQERKKKKEEQQEKERQLELERQRQKIAAEERKQKQILRQIQETKFMQKEEQLSVLRQKEDNIQQMNKKSGRSKQNIKQKTKKQSSKKQSSKKQSSKKQSTKNSPIKTISIVNSTNHFNNFINFLQQSTSKIQYKFKIQYQKELMKCISQFGIYASQKVKQHLDERKVVKKTKCIINFDDLEVRYALGNGSTVNGKSTFTYNEIDILRKQFDIYKLLENVVVSLMKRLGSFKIRIPLICMINYRGVEFLCEGINEDLAQLAATDANGFNQISSQLSLIQKQLQILGCNLDRTDLMIKKILVQEQQVYILYLKENLKKKIKLKEVSVQDFACLDFFDKPIISLFDQEQLENIEKRTSNNMKEIIECVKLAQHINHVYASGQGQLDEEFYWKMILEEKTQIWDMINASGYRKKFVPKGILLKIYQNMSSVKFDYHPQMFIQSKTIVRSYQPKIMHYEFHSIQIIEATAYFNKYLSQNRLELAAEAFQLKKDLYQLLNYDINTSQGIQLIKNEVSLHVQNKRYQEAINVLKNADEKIYPYSFYKIYIKSLLISVYIILDTESEILEAFSELLQLINFYFGSNSFVHSNIYSILGHYYSKVQNKQREALKFYELSLDIAIQIYGSKNPSVADIYLTRAQHYLNWNFFEECEKDINQAISIYKLSSKNGIRMADALFLTAKSNLARKNFVKARQNLTDSIALYLKLNQYVQALDLCFISLQYSATQQQTDKILEKICSISLKNKNRSAIKKAIAQIIKKQLKAFPRIKPNYLLDLFQEDNYLSTEEIMLSIQQSTNSFGSILEMVKWSLNALSLRANTDQSEKASEVFSILLSIFNLKEEVQDIVG